MKSIPSPSYEKFVDGWYAASNGLVSDVKGRVHLKLDRASSMTSTLTSFGV